MKKFAAIAIIAALVLSAGIFMAEEAEKNAPRQREVMVDRNNDGKVDGVDIYNDNERVIKRGYDMDNDMMVDTWYTYDENTGMPIVTDSDQAFELRQN